MFKNKYLLICVFLFGLFTNSGYGQTDILAKEKIGFESTIEPLIDLERKIFFSDISDSISHFIIQKAEIYKKTEQYNDVIYTLERLSFSTLSDSLKTAIYYELGLASFLNHNYQQSIAYTAQSLHSDFSNNLYLSLNQLLITLAYNELEKYDSGFENALQFANHLEIPNSEKEILQNDIRQFYSEKNRPRFKKPAKAETMSAIIPGLGQCYSGYYAEGIANFTLHALLLSLSAYAVYETYYLTAYFGGINLLIRFYQGGTRRSNYLANKRNYILKKEYNKKIKDRMLQDFTLN